MLAYANRISRAVGFLAINAASAVAASGWEDAWAIVKIANCESGCAANITLASVMARWLSPLVYAPWANAKCASGKAL